MQQITCNGRRVAVNTAGQRIGETHHRAKLTDEDVATILELRDAGLSYAAIAAKWDDGSSVSKSQVRNICKGEQRGQTPERWKPLARLEALLFAHRNEK